MQLDIQKYLYDILTSINSINEFIGEEKNFSNYQKNKLLRRAVERELEIIGEATSKILKIDPTIEIDDARKIVDLRNWVIHGYNNIDDIIVWGIISKHLPILKERIEKLFE